MTEQKWLKIMRCVMTEQEWLQAADPRSMLKLLRVKTSERKLRLLAVACCHRTWHRINRKGQSAVDVAEQYADGTIGEKELTAALDAAINADVSTPHEQRTLATLAAFWAANKQVSSLERVPYEVAKEVASSTARSASSARWKAARDGEFIAQTMLIRDIFGNPFRPVSLDPAWLAWHNGLLVSMARQMYESRDFADLPVMADALEEAGCTNQDILGHCRQRGAVHVRGCWVVDLLLGKE